MGRYGFVVHHQGEAYGKNKYNYNLQEVVAMYILSRSDCFSMENSPENKNALFLSSPMTYITQVQTMINKLSHYY